MKQNVKKMLLLKGMEPRLGVKKNYQDFLFGLQKVIKGEVRFDSRHGKTRYHSIYPFEGDMPARFDA